MATTHFGRGNLIIKDENLGIHQKQDVIDAKSKSFRTKGKGVGIRKPLNDITNKSFLSQEVSLKKKDLPKEVFNIADEMFLHDHKKCIEAQRTADKPCFLETVLPGYDLKSHVEHKSRQQEADFDSSAEPVELPELSEWLASYKWNSPPSSPPRWDSPPSSPLAWNFKHVEFVLKPETAD